MYREETEYSSNFYEYVGMANVSDDGKFTPKTAADINLLRDKAIHFREKSLEYMPNGFDLQLLEQAVVVLMPDCIVWGGYGCIYLYPKDF